MSYLVVVAHPDDEVLGAGGFIRKLANLNQQVNVCILSGGVEARTRRPSTDLLNQNIHQAAELLGVSNITLGAFPNIAFNTVAHLELVQFIEQAIIKSKAHTIFTHHPADLNNDHYHTSIACQAAARLYQRREDVTPLRELLFMEVSSSTEWGLNVAENSFRPNVFVELGEELLDVKIRALACYQGVMRDYPHPRSELSLKSLAAYRGSQAGVFYAEAFESAFRRISLDVNMTF